RRAATAPASRASRAVKSRGRGSAGIESEVIVRRSAYARTSRAASAAMAACQRWTARRGMLSGSDVTVCPDGRAGERELVSWLAEGTRLDASAAPATVTGEPRSTTPLDALARGGREGGATAAIREP